MLRTSRSLSRASTGLRSNQRISRPWRLHRRIRSSTDSGKRRSPMPSAARSRSGKSLRDISWWERISRCANCRPVVPVCASSSGIAACSRFLENRNAGSSGTRVAAPPGSAGCSSRSALSSRNQVTGALEHAGQQLEQVGGGRALAALDHAQVRDRRRPLRVALDAARRELLERQSVALAQRAQLGAEEVALAQQVRHRSRAPGSGVVLL